VTDIFNTCLRRRFAATDALSEVVAICHGNLSVLLSTDNDAATLAFAVSAHASLAVYTERLFELVDKEDEIVWDMLSASAFISSVSSTTGAY
jgi:hypothetical protein